MTRRVEREMKMLEDYALTPPMLLLLVLQALLSDKNLHLPSHLVDQGHRAGRVKAKAKERVKAREKEKVKEREKERVMEEKQNVGKLCKP